MEARLVDKRRGATAGNARRRWAWLLTTLGVLVLAAVPAAAESPDYPADTTTTGTVAVGGSQTGALEGRSDVDWIRAVLVNGTTYVIDYEGSETGQGTLRDPYLRGIYNVNGKLISDTTDDNGGQGRNSRLIFTAGYSTAGSNSRYFLGLGTTSPSSEGTYRVSVTEGEEWCERGDDYENDTTTTGSVSVGGSATGRFHKRGWKDWICWDHDWFGVTLDAGKTYRIDIKNSGLKDTAIVGIYDSNGNRISGTADDDSGVLFEARTFFTAPNTGTYYISATQGESGLQDSGAYTVEVEEVGADDYSASTSTAGSVAVGGSTTGTIERPGDVDWFAVALQERKRYQFDLESVGTDWPLEERLIGGIYDSNGDGFADTYTPESVEGDVELTFDVAHDGTGTYYVAVAGQAPRWASGTGKYRLSVTDLGFVDVVPEDVSTQASVDVGGSVRGRFESTGDEDWYKVALEAGKTYRFDLEGLVTSGDGWPYLRGIHDSGGSLITGTLGDNHATKGDSRAYFTPDAGGTYYVAAGAIYSLVGTYLLSVAEETIADEDGRTVKIASDETRAESAGSMDFLIELSRAASALVTVEYSTKDGTAKAGEDYVAISGRQLVFEPGRTRQTVWVSLIDDDVDDSGETFTLELSNASGATITGGTATGTILNTESLTATFPASAYASTSHSGAEDRPQVVIEFDAAVAPIAASTPSVTVAGGSVSGVQRHTKEEMANAWLFFVAPSGGGDVVFTLSVGEPCNAGGICTTHGTPLTTVPGPRTIPGPGDAGPTLSVADASADEGDAVEFTVSLSAASDEQVTVEYETTGGTATSGTDFTDTSGTVEFAAGDTSKTVSVPTTEDRADEEDETFTLTLSSPANATLGNATATGMIEDDDPAPLTGFTLVDAGTNTDIGLIANGGSFTLDDPANGSYGIRAETAAGVAIGSVQFALSGAKTVSHTEGIAPYSLYGDDGTNVDGEGLPTGSYTLTATAYAEGNLGGDQLGTLTVSFEVAAVATAAAVSVADAAATEGDAVEFTVSLSAPADDEVTVEYETTGGTATSGADFTADSGKLTFAAGETTKTVSVATTDDSADEEDETFTLTLSDPTNATLGDATATGTIVDDDETPALSVSDARVMEAEGATLDFVVTLDPPATGAVTVDYATADGTATAGVDYEAASDTLTFAAGETTKTIAVPIKVDTVDEDGETLTLTLSDPTGAELADAEATGTIRDFERHDRPHDLEAAATDEGVVLTWQDPNTYDPHDLYTILRHRPELGEAEPRAYKKYVYLKDRTFTDTAVEAGVLYGYAVKAVKNVLGDLGPMSETVEVRVPADREANSSLSVADASADEGDAVVFTVSLSAASDDEVTVEYETAGGTATSGTDFGADSGTLTFAAGETTKTVSVATTDDAVDEADETFTLTLSDPANATLGNAMATGTIKDDDTPPTVGVSDASASEGDAVVFAVSLSAASESTVTVGYGTAGGTATSGTDFEAASGTVEFTAGETSKTVSVATTEDSADEKDETFTLTLSSPVNATLGAARATGTIEDDDEPPLTATFQEVPPEHENEIFTFEVLFSEKIPTGYKVLRDKGAFAVTGGKVVKAKRVPDEEGNGRDDLREIHIEPRGWDDVTVTLSPTTDCLADGAICMADGRKLSNTQTATVKGPLALSVADARAEEGKDPTLDFVVTLSRAVLGTVTVKYATADGTATAEDDYIADSGTLSFAAGETEKTVSVTVIDDDHNEVAETMKLKLSDAVGARIRDDEAVGTIENSDAIPQAWLARFGRTVADHVVDAVGTRLTGPAAGGGNHVTLGGQRIALDGSGAPMGGDEEAGRALSGREAAGLAAFADRIAGGTQGAAPSGSAWTGWDEDGSGGSTRTLTERELLLGSSFHLSLGADGENAGAGGTAFTAWGQAASSRFDGEADGLALDGDVTTFTLGADAAWSRWLAGVAVSLSEGTGSFRDHEDSDHEGRGSGELESSLTGVHPYARLDVNERLMLWGLLGYGTGELTLELDSGERWTTDIEQEMAALGARGVVVAAPATGGLELAVRTDAVLQRMRSDAATSTRGGNLAETEAETSRVRLMLEGSRAFETGGGGQFTPRLEVGLRQDGGDAETGTGIELGGGLSYTDPASGLAVEAKVRGLVAHEDADYSEWGASGAIRIAPGADGRGLSLTLSPTWGAASGGAKRLWSHRDARAFAPGAETEAGSRLDAELGYGFSVLDGRAVATPHVGLTRSETDETLRLGQRLKLGASEWTLESAFSGEVREYRAGYGWRLGQSLDLTLDALRREATNDDGHELMLRARMRW